MICTRHGGPLEAGRCWECDMERDIAYQEREEAMRAAEFKLNRDLEVAR